MFFFSPGLAFRGAHASWENPPRGGQAGLAILPASDVPSQTCLDGSPLLPELPAWDALPVQLLQEATQRPSSPQTPGCQCRAELPTSHMGLIWEPICGQFPWLSLLGAVSSLKLELGSSERPFLVFPLMAPAPSAALWPGPSDPPIWS